MWKDLIKMYKNFKLSFSMTIHLNKNFTGPFWWETQQDMFPSLETLKCLRELNMLDSCYKIC